MKKIKFLALALSTLLLAGCSTTGSEATPPMADTQDNTTVEVAQGSAADLPKATITVEQNDLNQLVATIFTTYNGNGEGSVDLQWDAPAGTNCYDTQFPITKYSEDNDRTWASVSLEQGGKFCEGEWVARVIHDGETIASYSIDVKEVA